MIYAPYQRARASKTKAAPFKIRLQLLLGIALLVIGSAVFFYSSKASFAHTAQSAGTSHWMAVACVIAGALAGLAGVFLALLSLLKSRA